MPRLVSTSRCWTFELKFCKNPLLPLHWKDTVQFACWEADKDIPEAITYNIRGYLQFASARRFDTMRRVYNEYCRWRTSSHAPAVYEELLDKCKYRYGQPLPFYRHPKSSTPNFVKGHLKCLDKDIENDKIQRSASRQLLNYLKSDINKNEI